MKSDGFVDKKQDALFPMIDNVVGKWNSKLNFNHTVKVHTTWKKLLSKQKTIKPGIEKVSVEKALYALKILMQPGAIGNVRGRRNLSVAF